MKTPIEIRPSPISVQNFTPVRCAVVEFIAYTRYDASRLLFSIAWRPTSAFAITKLYFLFRQH